LKEKSNKKVQERFFILRHFVAIGTATGGSFTVRPNARRFFAKIVWLGREPVVF
jgi:hypothetical protein